MRNYIDELLNFVVGLVIAVLTLRFILKLFGANPEASFVSWTYETTAPLLQPFIAAFPTPSIKGGFTLEFTTLFAILVYAFVGFLVQELITIVTTTRVNREPKK